MASIQSLRVNSTTVPPQHTSVQDSQHSSTFESLQSKSKEHLDIKTPKPISNNDTRPQRINANSSLIRSTKSLSGRTSEADNGNQVFADSKILQKDVKPIPYLKPELTIAESTNTQKVEQHSQKESTQELFTKPTLKSSAKKLASIATTTFKFVLAALRTVNSLDRRIGNAAKSWTMPLVESNEKKFIEVEARLHTEYSNAQSLIYKGLVGVTLAVVKMAHTSHKAMLPNRTR